MISLGFPIYTRERFKTKILWFVDTKIEYYAEQSEINKSTTFLFRSVHHIMNIIITGIYIFYFFPFWIANRFYIPGVAGVCWALARVGGLRGLGGVAHATGLTWLQITTKLMLNKHMPQFINHIIGLRKAWKIGIVS